MTFPTPSCRFHRRLPGAARWRRPPAWVRATAVAGLLVASFAAASQTPATIEPPALPMAGAHDAGAPADYRIASGDELTLKFFYVPELNETVTVRPDGKIHLPLIGAVPAAELTPEQLAQRLRTAYAGDLRYPEVAVELGKDFARQQVFIGGEVAQPGMQTLTPQLTLMRAIILAQGMKDTAAPNRVLILRRDAQGASQVIEADLARQLHGRAGEDPTLQPYDVVLVPPSRVSRLNRWVDQYIRRNLPLNLVYDINRQLDP